MTDELCKVENCSYPLMRSKDGTLSFCTLHDELPTQGANHHYEPRLNNKKASADNNNNNKQEPLQASQQGATEADDDMEAELRRRREMREQSSRASQLIGQKMLQRWALLNEHCPNNSCYAIPLIRNPETKQKYCVICENVILTEEELKELEKNKAVTDQNGQDIDKDKGRAYQISPSDKKEMEQELKQLLTQHTGTEQTTVARQNSADHLTEKPKSVTSIASSTASKKHSHRRKHKKHDKTLSSNSSDINEQSRVVEHKRQRTVDSSVSHTSSELMISALTCKMEYLAELVEHTDDPVHLIDLFKSIKECASAIKACVEAAKLLPQM
ncbi:hypothetical protein BDF20DRAFT_873266 [Mycotypha africana]|uniref:uncharacterized protein n=1 Tax=Mycotypha africana TaxID=64632 RepID=UPI002300C4FF|nr:uncharacterized protein BDF20DRAFT_873266 [Mycotypha africana]KAI8977149.1 hypothetical protein BDF20DRAFT_873266 [Mycotypha africana]